MRRIAYISPNPNDASSFYRSNFVLPYLNCKDLSFVDFSTLDKILPRHLVNIHAIILQRAFSPTDVEIILLAKTMGVRIILDYDDNLLDLPVSNPAYSLYDTYREQTMVCLRLADEIWVSTYSLKERYSWFNDHVHVIPNAHNDYIFPVNKRKKFNINGKKIGYRGGPSSEIDLYRYKNELVELINNNPEHQFNFIGSRFVWLEEYTNANHTMSDPTLLMDYFKTLHKYNPNIFFYPLDNTVFNQCKSNISFIEATYAGAAFIGNCELDEFKNLPIFDLSQSFTKAFEYVLNDWENVYDMSEDAWEYVQENLLLSNINTLRKDLLLA
ncbi:MAG: putative glycosyltransferase (glycogen phosphorylase), family [Segetibacter sp.]|nr:putative glycosyltransferase (glycogen phosphorylase), family [Segetibacter sp.]